MSGDRIEPPTDSVAVIAMHRAVLALRLELPVPIWNDVWRKWEGVLAIITEPADAE